MNMDYSMCQAINHNTEGIEIILKYYDVICQWWKHFNERVERSPYLNLPTSLKEMKKAIGLFHVHGHKDTCIPSFSPNYIIGARQFDGEVVETLWAPLNEISRSTSGMTTSHRREVLDDHMNDSNWKKMTGMVSYLTRKYKEGKAGIAEARLGFENIDATVGAENRNTWLKAEQRAQDKRSDKPEVMVPIYDTVIKTAPSRAEILSKLNERERKKEKGQGAAAWITLGLRIQETQLSILAHLRKLGKNLTTEQKNDLADRRRRLQARVSTFERAAGDYLPQDTDVTGGGIPLSENEGEDFDLVGEDGEDIEQPEQQHAPGNAAADGTNVYVPVERVALSIPSCLDDELRALPEMRSLLAKEAELREGQANDALQSLRLALGHKAFVFRHDVRNAGSQRGKTRAWADVMSIENTVQQQARIYRKAREALVTLKVKSSVLKRLQLLERAQLKVHTAVLDPVARGLRNANLPWFWSVDVKGDSAEATWLADFHRVQWLRTCARLHRWEEQMVVLPFEMEWTVCGFRTRGAAWNARKIWADRKGKLGHLAYAAHQSAMWAEFATTAEAAFAVARGDDPPSQFGM
ncbi:hypothetical protein EWM64_g2719 [Hericium alpestre]|uniref:CxC1-like cysteine cluster associated with KDZ transposases domain-containing protein n=1 Tax=Hericium alpestre TaxID=135208 RepID=A0A4Z0A2N9_9AGAM|nr:hypothetical protein EWM64_g2719 [Hericium alpestre]